MNAEKLMAIGIIFLFIGVAVAPSINAHNDMIKPKAVPNYKKEVSLIVLEYKPDGTVGKSVIKMSQGQSERLRAELKGVSDLDTRLSIYKKYGLITQNISVDKLREGMEEKAQKMGLTQQKLTQLTLKNNKYNSIYISINLMCLVNGYGNCALFLPLGFSWFTTAIYYFLDIILPCFDFSDRIFNFEGKMTATKGLLPDKEFGWGSYIIITGFVGFMIYEPGLFYSINVDVSGFSAIVRALYAY